MMMLKITPPARADQEYSHPAVWDRLRAAAARAAEGALRELPSTLRRLRTLLLVVTITVPVFLLGLLVVLWHVLR